MRVAINNNWKFTKYWDADMVEPDYNDLTLETVRLPHTFVEMPLNYGDEKSYQLDAGYRYTFDYRPEWHGKRVELELMAAGHVSVIYVNGREIKRHNCGYTAIYADITGQLEQGKNVITVRCDSRVSNNIPPFGRMVDYMTYGGLYRGAWLNVTNRTYLEDVFAYTKNVDKEEKNLTTKVVVGGYQEGLKIRQKIAVHTPVTGSDETNTRKTGEGKEENILNIIRDNTLEPERKLLGEETLPDSMYTLRQSVKHVSLWTIEQPSLYDLTVELINKDGELLDEKTIVIGFREAVFNKEGFFLNGEKIKLRGLNRHQSFPYVGYAMPKSMQELDADILKWELSVNAVRTSHYPQSQDFVNRCDEIGLLVFTEMPGWQYIGDDEWQNQAVENVKEMVMQYRNHPSIILWGVRINESADNHDFYKRTNDMAHKLDESRQTGGVRCIAKSELLEDVYTYNDFSYNGEGRGCEEKSKVTDDMEKGYLVSEYAGHMYPVKSFDTEENRLRQALFHATILKAVAEQKDIAGSFGWCMFDYNTTKDFGSGDRICYHGVLDAFRNPKLAAAMYEMQSTDRNVLNLSSTMNIGEHPASLLGKIYAFTNADSLKLYKNERFIKEYDCRNNMLGSLKLPVLLDDFIGDEMEEREGFTHEQSEQMKQVMAAFAEYGMKNLPPKTKMLAAKLMVLNRMTLEQTGELYNKYVGNWGNEITTYKVEAVKEDKVVKTLLLRPNEQVVIKATIDHTHLKEEDTYDVAAVRLEATDEFGSHLPFFGQPVQLKTEGNIELIGPELISFSGGYTGFYVKTRGFLSGKASVTVKCQQADEVRCEFVLN